MTRVPIEHCQPKQSEFGGRRAQLEKDKANLTYAKLALGRAATLLPTHAVSERL